MKTRLHNLKARRLVALVAAVPLATGGLLVATQLPAFDHTSAIIGTAVCDTSTGTYTVHWTGTTLNVPSGYTATVEITAHSPSGSTVPPSPLTTTLAPDDPYAFDQTGIPGSATAALVAVHVHWTDAVDAYPSGSITGLTG